ncbi:MAG: hypothetical protein PHX21_11400 [bacterium]|nr:hypothetical protein [bacterium]
MKKLLMDKANQVIQIMNGSAEEGGTYYHTVLWTGETAFHWWANFGYEELLQELIIPYINKQVVLVAPSGENKAIMNFGAVSYLKVFKTVKPLYGKKTGDRLLSRRFRNKECTQEVIEAALLNKSLADSKSLLQLAFTPDKKQVFVIMDFKSKLLNSAYDNSILPVIREFEYRPVRIDEIVEKDKVNSVVLEEMAKSNIIIVDLTESKNNFYYLIGFAYAIGKEIIFTARKGTSHCLDFKGVAIIEWNSQEALKQALSKKIKNILRKVESKPLSKSHK